MGWLVCARLPVCQSWGSSCLVQEAAGINLSPKEKRSGPSPRQREEGEGLAGHLDHMRPRRVPGECPPPWAGHTLRPFSSRTNCGFSTAPYLGLRFAFSPKVKTVKPVVLKAWESGARSIPSQTQKRQYFKVYVMEFLIFSISSSAVLFLGNKTSRFSVLFSAPNTSQLLLQPSFNLASLKC